MQSTRRPTVGTQTTRLWDLAEPLHFTVGARFTRRDSVRLVIAFSDDIGTKREQGEKGRP
jgi:hypothetical protein